MLVQEARTQRDKFDDVVTTVKPVLDCVDLEPAPQPNGRPQCLDTINHRCRAAWENFKSFNRDATIFVVTHALAVVWSHYPTINLRAIGVGFTRGTGVTKQEQLKDEVEDTAKSLADNVDLFGEADGEGQT